MNCHWWVSFTLLVTVKVEMDVETGRFYGEFTWENSFEAAEHMRLYGISDHAVCWNLLGYATGYTTVFMGKPIYFKEVECVGKGDKQCRIIGKPLEDWEDADIVLAGVSRTSKTPTSIYLANRGYKVANIPIVVESPPPPAATC